ncbi:hypothetical protein LK12_18280 [Novosphingobium malaysiense]|uniref:Uncharacterized protein n=1 Tax=Novosphingobium malaysiense TaxID=1348853 RepID=A0A0B1ZH62_9SPHN|nr:hypothetical protein LK12_18280 [Novosphingobium malaysiense]
MTLATRFTCSASWVTAVTATGTSCMLCARFCAVTMISSRPPEPPSACCAHAGVAAIPQAIPAITAIELALAIAFIF